MNILTQNFGKVSNIFGGPPEQDELSAGVQASFGIVGYKGKVWSTRYRGQETPLMRADGDGPRSSIDVVILKAAGVISKTWYEGAFVEGERKPPDCFSTNGQSPSLSSPKRQSNVCATCARNVWGSKITPAGKNSKECNDTKRLAVVPDGDIRNEGLGGPMLLRVPPASLATMAAFGSEWNQKGFPYYSIVTRISFDPENAYPKFLFKAVRPLSDEEAQIVMEMRGLPQMERLLQEGSEFAGDPRLLQEGVQQSTGDDPNSGGTGWVKPQVSEAQVAQAQKELQGGFGKLGVAGQAPASSPPTSSAPAQTQTNSTSSTPKARGSRSTGAASSRSAPPAASTGLNAPATTNSSAPATASPATPAPQGFGTASSASDGSDQEILPPKKLNPADVPDDEESETHEGTGVDPFEEELDAQLNAFLPQ